MPDDLLNGQSSQSEQKNADLATDLGDQNEQSPLEEAMAKLPEENTAQQAVPQNPPAEPVSPPIPPAEPTPTEMTPEPSNPSEPPSPENSSQGDLPQEPVIPSEPSPAPSSAIETPPASEPTPAPISPEVDNANADPAVMPTPDYSSESPSSPQSDSPVPSSEEETSKTPDTDEFLKSILNDQPQDTSTAAPDQAPQQSENAYQPTPEPPQYEPSPAMPEPEPAIEEPIPSQQPEAPQQDIGSFGQDVQDANGNMDGISGGSNVPPMPVPEVPQPELNPDSIQAPKSSGSPARLIILIVVAAILVIGGYLAYTLLFASNSTNTKVQNPVQDSVTVVPSSSSDQVRKTDLIKIQQALLNYFAGTGKYPVAATMIYLNTANNVVDKALVPAYLNAMPTDPNSPTKNYAYKSDGKTFTLSAVLDNSSDPEGVAEGSITLYKVTEATKATATTGVPTTVDANATKTINSEASISATPVI